MELQAMDNQKLRKLLISIAIGAVAGFIVSFALMRTIQTGLLGDLGASRSIAALLGAMYVLCGVFVGLGVLSPKLGARFLNVEDADELREQSRMLRNSTFGIIAFGLSMLLLAFAAPAGPLPPGLIGGSIAVLMSVATLTSLHTLKFMDELNASVSRETSVASFYLMFFVGGGWSVLAHLGFVPALAPLDWLTMFAAAMLFAAFWVSAKRGLLVPR